ncbi:Fe(2+) transporter permease subunit FeoB [Francisella tularensis]|uniref:Fe(2+) transporter permease subunit FeoB n=1 Tax=Francisella tularensis TaxID=263 RepID=UPI0000F59358|nr:Fe(2+) transporter permease subunit FeoB [Francisella tularensis]ABO47523.1 ferrous iron transport protein B [Francisella tularensis subsp. tularensis WY96-3418]AKH92694.1 ferrous iron transporter B [Francisella tularensis subsp. tularensis WY-00W4114]AKU74549.1 ferrous iron transport protein B [Francisella tularensis subsp. tularensis]EKM84791.1 ferrous iron transport protein B [Francisella tularensis subsp. tularensis 831]EKM84963.1 ferrous iron transport protein B [Francisella tularensis
MKYALVGNPNCGKTTIFNALTGLNQKVGNWSGVTVDKKTGFFNSKDKKIEVVDIPGIYSLSVSDANSIDEQIAYSFVVKEKPNAIINVVDASNLNRSLYLTMQLIELGLPVILVVNMIDVANKKGLIIHYDRLEKTLGCKVLPVVAAKGIGIKELKETLADRQKISSFDLKSYYSRIVTELAQQITTQKNDDIGSLWLAIELIDGRELQLSQEITASQLDSLKSLLQSNTDIDIAKVRYNAVAEIVASITENKKVSRFNFTKALDALCMNKYLGVPIFLLMMYLMFLFSITLGGAIQPMFDDLSHAIFVDGLAYYSNMLGLPTAVTGILANGLGTGINTVLGFIPQIGFLFIFLSILEDSGYMSRAAFVMDRFMQSIGLSGKAFVPLIVGFGCNVASIMAARTLETRKDRLMTLMMSPFMSCGARLAIFSVFASAFFPHNGATVIFLLYLAGIFGAIITGYIIKFTFLKGDTAPFILDIPNYHTPSFKTVMIYSWNRLKSFLIRAGKVIVPVAIIVGSLNSIYIGNKTTALEYAGKKITPILNPMGINDDNWPATVGLITGTLAKEVVVGTLNTIYTQGEDNVIPDKFSLIDSVKESWNTTIDNIKGIDLATLMNPIEASKADANMDNGAMGNMVTKFGSLSAAFAYLLFVLLYIPCISVVGAMVRESTRGWAILSVLWSVSIAYVAAVVIYQLLNIAEHPSSSIICIALVMAYIIGIVFLMKYLSTKINFVANLTGCSSCSSKKCS